jgi:hypothetical protein
MGYRMSRQRSLGGYSLYFLLFGKWPIVGASVRDNLQGVVDLDSPEEWARLVNERAKVFEKHLPSTTWRCPSIGIYCGTLKRGPGRSRASCSVSSQGTTST